jgi:hypothetical protein
MVIAALIAFAVLLIAWIMAPTEAAPLTAVKVAMGSPEPEVMPEAA